MRFATERDVIDFYGELPEQTLRAVVLVLNNAPVALIGMARQDTYAQFFSEYRPEYRPHLKSMTTLRAIKSAMSIVKESRLPVFAVAESTEPDAVRLLTRLGFAPFGDRNVFRWHS